jgi:phosphatidylserine decarboxylase
MISYQYPHQYVDRQSCKIITESLLGDKSVSFIYSTVRENAPAMFRALTSGRMSSLLSFYHYDFLDGRRRGNTTENLFENLNIDWRECVEPLSFYDTARKVFERQICYWEHRPMDDSPAVIVSPADSRVLVGSLSEISELFIKEKLFTPAELFGFGNRWHPHFQDGDFAVFRLTPDKYHYNHLPVSGTIRDIYEVDGNYHSCNPTALISLASLYAKNKRVITVIDTDVPDGSGVGLVAMIEVVALMIGDIVQTYSEERYNNPVKIEPGMFVKKGCPKSLYRPGSSTDIVIFERGKMEFSSDLISNSRRKDVQSRFTNKVGQPLVETDIQVRSTIGHRAED